MVSSKAAGRSPCLLARPARARPQAPTRGTPTRASRNPEVRASPRDEMASAEEASEGGVRLLLVGSPPDLARVEAAAEACVAERRHLLVLFRGDVAGEGPSGGGDRDDEARDAASRRKEDGVEPWLERDARTARDLESACDAIARVAPVLEFTPLLMELGWDEKSARARADALARPSNEVVVDDATKKNSGAAFRDSFLHERCPTNVGSRGGFAKVSVGGTFDRLHAGHRLLLAAAALVTDARSGTLYVGVTGEALLANKSDKNKIQPYETRARNARRFLESVLPGRAKMRVEMGPLDGAPPLASTVQDMCALVVSRETLAGAAAVNAQREARGFPPLEIVATGVVGGVGDDDESRRRSKLSSSALRAAAEVPATRDRRREGSRSPQTGEPKP